MKGAKVVCVDDINYGDVKHPLLTEGAIYTISSAYFEGGCPFVDLVELSARDNGWFISRFRPVTPRSAEQDIAEHFAHHLDQRVPEKA